MACQFVHLLGGVEFNKMPFKLLPNSVELHLDTFDGKLILAVRDSQRINVQVRSYDGKKSLQEFNYPINDLQIKWFKWLPKQKYLVYEHAHGNTRLLSVVGKMPSGLWTLPKVIDKNEIKDISENAYKWVHSPDHSKHVYFPMSNADSLFLFRDSLHIKKTIVLNVKIESLFVSNETVMLWGINSKGYHEAICVNHTDGIGIKKREFLSFRQNDALQNFTPKYGSLDTKFQVHANLHEGTFYIIKWGHYDGIELRNISITCLDVSNLSLKDSIYLPLNDESFEVNYSFGRTAIRNFNTIYPLRLSINHIYKTNDEYIVSAIYKRFNSVNTDELNTNLSEAKASYMLRFWHEDPYDKMKSKVIPLNHIIFNSMKSSSNPIPFRLNSSNQDLRVGTVCLYNADDQVSIFNDTRLNYLASNRYSKTYDGKSGQVLTMVYASMKDKVKKPIQDSLQQYVLLPSQEILYLDHQNVLCFALDKSEPVLLKISLKSKD